LFVLLPFVSLKRTFLRYYGLIAGRFCLLHPRWKAAFEESFSIQYESIHRLETNKLRNVAKLFAHLLHTDSLPWSCLSVIHLNEDETTSSSRIFLKILVQEMAGAMGIDALVKRFETKDADAMQWYTELLPRNDPRKTRYAINFFTSIGLGPLTDGLREHLKNAPKLIMMQAQAESAKRAQEVDQSDDSSSASSVSSSSSSTMDSSTLSSSDTSRSSISSDYSNSSRNSYTSYSSNESSISYRRRRRRLPNVSSSASISPSSQSSRLSYKSISNDGRLRKKRKSSMEMESRRKRRKSKDRKKRSLSHSSSSSH